MNVPIEDAVTVAYVGVVHAVSHIEEYLDDPFEVGIEELEDVLNDLNRALEMLRPHCRESR